MSIHTTSSPLAGSKIRIKNNCDHEELRGKVVTVDDYWDRLNKGDSWRDTGDNPAAHLYTHRVHNADGLLPVDDEVVYGMVGSVGYLVHVSELEGQPDHKGRQSRTIAISELIGGGVVHDEVAFVQFFMNYCCALWWTPSLPVTGGILQKTMWKAVETYIQAIIDDKEDNAAHVSQLEVMLNVWNRMDKSHTPDNHYKMYDSMVSELYRNMLVLVGYLIYVRHDSKNDPEWTSAVQKTMHNAMVKSALDLSVNLCFLESAQSHREEYHWMDPETKSPASNILVLREKYGKEVEDRVFDTINRALVESASRSTIN